jgi:murein peptide amidase A
VLGNPSTSHVRRMQPRPLSLLAVASLVAASALAAACDESRTATPDDAGARQAVSLAFVLAPAELGARCRATARALGYAVPCPTRVPAGLSETGAVGPTGCGLHIIGAGGLGNCAKSWRGWVVGSSQTDDEHLVISASPRPLTNDAKMVNGPAWYPKARVRPVGSLTINGWRMHAVYVPAATNDGSSFANHVVLIWTVGAHTYAIGFHNVHGLRTTLRLDQTLARAIRLVGTDTRRLQVVPLGRSQQGRAIVAVRSGNPQGTRVLVFGCIHGTECAGVAVARALERVHAPVDLWIVPDLNPDGYARDTRQNGRGVDLNANWSSQWHGGGRPWDTYYPGQRPFSERETRIARNLILRIRPRLTIWYHQHMNLVWAFGPSSTAGRIYARAAGMRFYDHHWLPGTATNWQNHHLPRSSSLTVELPAGSLTPQQLRRQVHAVLTLAATTRGPAHA